jgi:hypothetical protein
MYEACTYCHHAIMRFLLLADGSLQCLRPGRVLCIAVVCGILAEAGHSGSGDPLGVCSVWPGREAFAVAFGDDLGRGRLRSPRARIWIVRASDVLLCRGVTQAGSWKGRSGQSWPLRCEAVVWPSARDVVMAVRCGADCWAWLLRIQERLCKDLQELISSGRASKTECA